MKRPKPVQIQVALTKPQIETLLSCVEFLIESGSHFGPVKAYRKKLDRVKEILEASMK